MIDLDDVERYRQIDRHDMLGRIAELPEQCRDAWNNVTAFDPPDDYGEMENIVVTGMGGSAIGGDLVRTLVTDECPVPIVVNRHYHLPGFVGENTLVIASSYSGNTEETLTSFEEALAKGARCLAVTTGGRLAKLARDEGRPILRFSYESQPRAAVGHSFVLLLGLLQKLGLIGDHKPDLDEGLTELGKLQSRINEEVPAAENQAKALAQSLHGRFAIVYGAEHLSQVARRWKTQINENSKAWGNFEVMPELNHNAVVGYEHPTELWDEVGVVCLVSSLYQRKVRRRFEITQEILGQTGIKHRTVEAWGQNALAQTLTAIHLGDYVSYYLAILYEEDPTPVENITYLKVRLAE